MSKSFFLLITALVSLSASAEVYKDSDLKQVSYSSGQERGAGSGIAAEFHRAMDDFIKLVKENKDYFPGVNIKDLEAAQLRVLVNYKPIRVCNTSAVLDAHSNIKKQTIFVNQAAWVAKSWQDKVHISGHELLLNTGYEKSNQYQLSNQVYKIDKDYLSKKYGDQSLCQIDPHNCDSYYGIKDNLNEYIKLYTDKKINLEDLQILIEMRLNTINIVKRTSIGIKLLQLERTWYAMDKEGQIERFIEALELAVDRELGPIIEEIRILSSSKLTEKQLSCVEL
ncbi:MAG: hypothetical protein MK008_03655 [Bdellovibrionales bacterium]|nr:hypothetical protein [Bdellovibrionales bacterium]